VKDSRGKARHHPKPVHLNRFYTIILLLFLVKGEDLLETAAGGAET